MSSRSSQSRRKKRRSGNAPMPLGGAGLMRFFEDSSIGIKVSPITTVSYNYCHFFRSFNFDCDICMVGDFQLVIYSIVILFLNKFVV